jgi:D-sedoheptulose 7-phosphate isomerase
MSVRYGYQFKPFKEVRMTQVAAHSPVFTVALEEHLSVVHDLERSFGILEQMAKQMYQSLRSGKKVMWCGNGGSAADSQHLAAELVGRFRRDRKGLASVALTTDTSILTAVSNDYGFECVFSRQVESLCQPDDIVIGISTSGNSANVCAALIKARELGAYTFAMTGKDGGRMASLADTCLKVESEDTARIQETHILAGHMLCDWIETTACNDNGA